MNNIISAAYTIFICAIGWLSGYCISVFGKRNKNKFVRVLGYAVSVIFIIMLTLSLSTIEM